MSLPQNHPTPHPVRTIDVPELVCPSWCTAPHADASDLHHHSNDGPPALTRSDQLELDRTGRLRVTRGRVIIDLSGLRGPASYATAPQARELAGELLRLAASAEADQ